MARPKKNNCDYFSHDNNMRNNKKIRALRAKFGHEGFSLWIMILEYLTGCDFIRFTYSALELELLAGDFGTTADRLKSVIQYLIDIKLLQITDTDDDSEQLHDGVVIYCKELSFRLSAVFDRRNPSQRGFSATETELMTMEIPKLNNTKINKIKSNQIDNPFKDSIQFSEAWQCWEQYRKEKKQKLTPASVKMQIKFLSQFGEEVAIQIINQSIQNGWTGLFELKNKNNGKRTIKDSAKLINDYFEGGNS
jgi:hypothetical protein